jgi:hypothetical protein
MRPMSVIRCAALNTKIGRQARGDRLNDSVDVLLRRRLRERGAKGCQLGSELG